MEKNFYPGSWQQLRAFSPAVATRGGRIIWLAGHGGLHGTDRNLQGDFDGQCRQAFANLSATLAQAGATLSDIVSMTVFITDARHGDRFVEIRKEFFPDANFPASALITITALARPAMMVEIQCVAVVPD
ncbi:MAG: RidA family protein [Synechococcus sp.]|nr:RidA family protein [Synechococcus sp.]